MKWQDCLSLPQSLNSDMKQSEENSSHAFYLPGVFLYGPRNITFEPSTHLETFNYDNHSVEMARNMVRTILVSSSNFNTMQTDR